MTSSPSSGARAGFWRRAGAFLLDVLLVGTVVSVLGSVAFALTDGRIQTDGVGIDFKRCIGSASIPTDLDPPPPEDSNHAELCSGGALPFAVSKKDLLVGRRTIISPGRTSFTWRTYPTSVTGSPIAAIDLTWVAQSAFAAYFIIGLVRRGRTLGMRLLRIRLIVLPAETAAIGVPVRRLLLRAGVAIAGFLPFAAVSVWVAFAPPGAHTGTLTAALLWTLWVGYNVILVVRRDDPVYDAVAGLAVLLDQDRRTE